MEKHQKCYIYTRVSTSMQVDGYSLDAQKDKLKKYADYQEIMIFVNKNIEKVSTLVTQLSWTKLFLIMNKTGMGIPLDHRTKTVIQRDFLLWRRGKFTHLCGAFDDR